MLEILLAVSTSFFLASLANQRKLARSIPAATSVHVSKWSYSAPRSRESRIKAFLIPSNLNVEVSLTAVTAWSRIFSQTCHRRH